MKTLELPAEMGKSSEVEWMLPEQSESDLFCQERAEEKEKISNFFGFGA